MPLARLVLCLTLLVSAAGSAQPLEPEKEQRPAQGEVFPREPAQTKPEDRYPLASRLVIQPLGGVLAGTLLGFVSSFPLIIASQPFCHDSFFDGSPRSDGCQNVIFTGMALAASFGSGACVHAIGESMGGHGRYWPTLLGALLGSLAGAGIGLAADASEVGFGGLLVVGPTLGAMVAYAVSDSGPPGAKASTAQAGKSFELLPSVGATPAGGLMAGLVGRF